MRRHKLKTWPAGFEAILVGDKAFEYRKNDRDFAVGDVLELVEWDPSPNPEAPWPQSIGYTGRTLERVVTYVLEGRFGVADGYCVLSLAEVKPEVSDLQAKQDLQKLERALQSDEADGAELPPLESDAGLGAGGIFSGEVHLNPSDIERDQASAKDRKSYLDLRAALPPEAEARLESMRALLRVVQDANARLRAGILELQDSKKPEGLQGPLDGSGHGEAAPGDVNACAVCFAARPADVSSLSWEYRSGQVPLLHARSMIVHAPCAHELRGAPTGAKQYPVDSRYIKNPHCGVCGEAFPVSVYNGIHTLIRHGIVIVDANVHPGCFASWESCQRTRFGALVPVTKPEEAHGAASEPETRDG